MSLNEIAKSLTLSQYDEFCSCKVIDIVRVDKKTSKDYNSYIDYSERYTQFKPRLLYKLSTDQLNFIKKIIYDIYTKLIGEREKVTIYSGFGYYHLSSLNDKLFYFQDAYGRALPPMQAEGLLLGLNDFYYKITNTEFIIINIDIKEGVIDLDEMRHVKSYIGEYEPDNIDAYNSTLPKSSEDDIKALVEQTPNQSIGLLKTLIDWISENESNDSLIKKLDTLKIYDVSKINLIVSISTLKNILEIWEENIDNENEEYWQQVLQNNSIVLSQLFSYPVVITKGKAYVGGKNIYNANGNIVDFLMSNKLTKNTALIEIKTPKTKLVSSKYREGVFNISQEVTGAIIQAASYKDSLLKEVKTLISNSSVDFEIFNPACLVIAGNFQKENLDFDQRRSFELFRGGLRDVQLITYDELFEKVRVLLNLLEGK